MNANELADYLLDHMHDGGMTDLVMGEAATMLRQQQVEIEAMRKDYMVLAGKYQDALLELKFGKAQEK